MTTSIEGSGERCPTCQAPLAADQRYCLECGNRRGDPRLPFMDAVVFMEAVKTQPEQPTPPPPSERKPQGITANAALIAGIGTLVLAIGVGVLIGRSGDNGSATAANAAPQIIKVGGGGGGEEEAAASSAGESTGATAKKSSGKAKKVPPKKEAQAEKEGEEAADEVLHSTVDKVKSGAQIGEGCDPSEAGCSKNGKFEGEFFGE